MAQISKSNLTYQKLRLIELMQGINFGRITNIPFRDGEPKLTPETVIEHEIKLSKQNGPRPEIHRDDFAIKQEVVALFDQLKRMDTGTISRAFGQTRPVVSDEKRRTGGVKT